MRGMKMVRLSTWGAVGRLFVSALVLFPLACNVQAGRTDQPHHADNGFKNLYPTRKHGFWDFLKWQWERRWKDIPAAESYNFPAARNEPRFLRMNRDKTTLTWIGHATLLLQIGGRNILTDPVFSDRASPVQWVGPKRVVPPGMPLDDLPQIDIVVISHDHYDALDEGSVRKIHERDTEGRTQFFVPLGFRSWFEKRGIHRVVELDWWDCRKADGLEITAVPVQHWSKRGLLFDNKRLWAGWAIRAPGFNFLFCGDSGYAPLFREIGRRLGPFDLAAIPIGAYEPRWFMRDFHLNPEEAVQVHVDLRSKRSIGIHWGTFILTDEPLDEPPERLEQAKAQRGLAADEFIVLKHGETILLK